jgi:hypothetical protein
MKNILVYVIILVLCFPVSAQKNKNEDLLFPIVKNKKWGFIDTTGKVICEPVYDWVGNFSEGQAVVNIGAAGITEYKTADGGKYGFINNEGKLVIEAKFDFALNFKEGMALIMLNDKCGFIDVEGNIVIPANTIMLLILVMELYRLSLKENMEYLIKRET